MERACFLVGEECNRGLKTDKVFSHRPSSLELVLLDVLGGRWSGDRQGFVLRKPTARCTRIAEMTDPRAPNGRGRDVT